MGGDRATVAEFRGGGRLVDWFGHEPSFHDAEILDLTLRRADASVLRLHTWTTLKTTNAAGFLTRDREAVVSIVLTDVLDADLREFNHQNVIDRLRLEHLRSGAGEAESSVKVHLDGSFGLYGWLVARSIEFDLSTDDFQVGAP